MLALKMLLTVAGALMLAVALAIPLMNLVTRILRARTQRSHPITSDAPSADP